MKGEVKQKNRDSEAHTRPHLDEVLVASARAHAHMATTSAFHLKHNENIKLANRRKIFILLHQRLFRKSISGSDTESQISLNINCNFEQWRVKT